jgi:2-desacetyl-2-hydroxyethyl bacteriochlorophyllide A dehydrogenase
MQAGAILFTNVNQAELAAITIPEPGEGELLVETAYSCISPGTELRCLRGQQPDAQPWPFIPGYALTGQVIACGAGTSLQPGTKVFCRGTQRASHARMWGGHVSHALVSERAVYTLPPEIDLRAASLAALVAIALHGVRLSRPQIDERVVVFGLGPIGQLSARLHALTGAQVVGVDRVAARVALLQAAGHNALLADDTGNEALQQILPNGADVVVDATGAPAALPAALALARDPAWGDGPVGGARYLLQGSYAGSIPIPYQEAFQKELQILVPRDLQPRDIRRALELIATGSLSVRDLISAVYTPEQAATSYAELLSGAAMTNLFGWNV